MTVHSFFNESTDQSKVKAAIVSKYFDAWASVIVGAQKRYKKEDRIAYIDLFAGPGRYKDGSNSTPLLVLQKAIGKADIRDRLVTVFNDKDERHTHALEQAIHSLPGIATLKHPPKVYNNEVGEEIVKLFEGMTLVPTLFFVDPWGYKGLSLRLVNSVIKNWGCDCIFFFNYNRISMGLSNPAVKQHMDCLFGEETVERIRPTLDQLDPDERETMIVEELCQALKNLGPRYVLPFRFKDDKGMRTSHHLVFVSKGFKGYEIMKEIMAKESSTAEQGVASFEYSPASERQPLLFELSRPLDDLKSMLLTEFAGKRLAMRAVYEQHNVDRPYTSRHYKQVLQKLEKEGKIKADKHRANSFGDDVMVVFRAL